MRNFRLPEEKELPKLKNPSEADIKYKPLMKAIGLENPTKKEIDCLRTKVAEKMIEKENEYRRQTMVDIATGKIKNIEDIPLYRKPDGRGGEYLCNIPDDYFLWAYFITWLNELSFSI